MSWVVIALLGAAVSALVSIFDKTVIYRYAKTPLTLPLLIGFGQVTVGIVLLAIIRLPDALTLTLRALGIGPGDEVITTALSAVYTAQAIMMAGARPVFADIDPYRLTLDPAIAAALVGPRTAAIMPVHLYGQPADLPALAAVADRHGLALVEDCCQAHLATCNGVQIGSIGVAAVPFT